MEAFSAMNLATVECSGATVKGCVNCIGPVVASHASCFRTNDLGRPETELRSGLSVATFQKAANRLSQPTNLTISRRVSVISFIRFW